MSESVATKALRQRIADRRSWLYRLAMVWTGEAARADDLVQEALVKCLGRCADLRDDNRLDQWLFSIMRNCWRDGFRDRWHGCTEFDEESQSDYARSAVDGPAQSLSRQKTVELVTAAVESLPCGQREVVVLVDIQGCSYAEVAETLAVPVGTVMSRLCRARKRLTELLAESDPGGSMAAAKVTRFRRVR